jgi:hypothetical protein
MQVKHLGILVSFESSDLIILISYGDRRQMYSVARTANM